jgi:DNA-binding CsgD family transcriptional regulator
MRSQTSVFSKIEGAAVDLAAWFSLDGCRFRIECACRSNKSGCLAEFSLHGRDYVILASDNLIDVPLPALTRREREIALLIARGLYTKQIAYDLGISPHTASTYINRIRTKLGVRNRPEMVATLLGWSSSQP